MDEHLKALKRVGIALIIVGVIDIGVMIYCIMNSYNYSSSFNIFALLSGIFLYRGGLTAARVVAWFSAFMVVTFVSFLITYPFTIPISLFKLQFSLNSWSMVWTTLFWIALTAFLVWIFIQLRHPSVLAARKEKGLITAPPKFAFIFGALLPASIAGVMFITNHSNSAQIVKAKAIQEYGDQYQYHINSMNWSGDSLAAGLVAYNATEMFPVYVSCNGSQDTNDHSKCSLRSPRGLKH